MLALTPCATVCTDLHYTFLSDCFGMFVSMETSVCESIFCFVTLLARYILLEVNFIAK